MSASDISARDEALAPMRALGEVATWHFDTAMETAVPRRAMEPAALATADAHLARETVERLAAVDTARAGTTVTDWSTAVNALRPATAELRAQFDQLIADYLTTGQYHESHEAFVTSALIAEQFLRAMADATTEQHDILDDAVGSNTRIVAALVRSAAYYATKISELPDSSFRNVAEQLTAHAEPAALGELANALLTVYGRVGALGGEAHRELAGRCVGAIDPDAAAAAGSVAVGVVSTGLRRNPAVARVLVRTAGRIGWEIVRAAVRR